jgi:hypothetical protein
VLSRALRSNGRWIVCPPGDGVFRSLRNCEQDLSGQFQSQAETQRACETLRRNFVIGSPETCVGSEPFRQLDDRYPVADKSIEVTEQDLASSNRQYLDPDQQYAYIVPKESQEYWDTLQQMGLSGTEPICDSDVDLQIAGLVTKQYNYPQCRSVKSAPNDAIQQLQRQLAELTVTIDNNLKTLAQSTYNAAVASPRNVNAAGVSNLTAKLGRATQTWQQRFTALNRLARSNAPVSPSQ